MDKLKFQGSRQISHVLSPYKCNTMDELAKDLNNALDESSDFRVHDAHTKVKRSKTWKCRSKTKNNMIYCNMLKYSAKSEDSESSLDNFPHQEMDVSRKGSHHYTDSDDILCKVNHLSSWRHCSTNVGESDSVNENLHPLREPRRKRKFKRMSVDPPSVAEHEFPSLSSIPFCSQKSKRLRNLKSHTVSKMTVRSPPKHPKFSVSQLSAEMENICKDFGNASTGKRKRAHERSFDSNNGCELQDFHSDKQSLSDPPCHHPKNEVTSNFNDMYNSGMSSSESDCGVLTNDESREADDEHSDFFQESGPAYGIPNFVPWWQDDDLIPDDQMFDPDFQTILTKSFQHMSDAAKKMYNMQVNNYKAGRQIRSGRRRLGKGSTPKQHQRMISPEELPIPRNEYDAFNLSIDNCLTKITPNEKKKRKGMPPLTGNIHGLAEFYPCIPESNVGFQVLKNMGWKPGTGLGSNGEGIVSPVKPSVSHGKQGLGFSKRNSENEHSAPPPPPPSSPQPFATKNDSLC